jgi:hypothetical protein
MVQKEVAYKLVKGFVQLGVSGLVALGAHAFFAFSR